MSVPYNQRFWTLVKDLVITSQSKLKPCKFYEVNKNLVEHEYKLLISKSEKKPHLKFGVSTRLQK